MEPEGTALWFTGAPLRAAEEHRSTGCCLQEADPQYEETTGSPVGPDGSSFETVPSLTPALFSEHATPEATY